MSGPVDYSQFEEGRYCNYWELDRTIRRELARVYPEAAFAWAEPRLSDFGAVVGHVLADNADYVDAHGPELHTYDKHGDVQNFVRYPAEQVESERLAYESGVVADSFRAPPGRDEPMPLTHYFGMLYLLSYAETSGFVCPVAMTAGAALVLEKFDDGELQPYYESLTSRSREHLIEGAMFLTEKQGGSDVGAAETTAEYDDEAGYWRLTGEKWFCSNIDGEGTLALARTPDAPAGTDGLSMFLVPHGDPEEGVLTKGRRESFDGPVPPAALNDQYYRRLKDKLGTTAVPTGEVEFDATPALLVGEREQGFKQMAEMLNLERLSNAAGACGIVGRALLESKIHAANREAFGHTIDEFPLMREDLVDMTVDHEAATAFTFEAARLFAERERAERATREAEDAGNGPDAGAGEGRDAGGSPDTGAGDGGDGDAGEGGDAGEDGDAGEGGDASAASGADSGGADADRAYRLMRLLVPIAKLRTARMAIETTSYAMEIQGGNGYVEGFVTERLLRDAQVLPIWEGTENVLSLDVLRALERERAHEPFVEVVDERLSGVTHPALADAVEVVEGEFQQLVTAMATLASEDREYAELSAKRLSHYIFDVFTAALLLEEAQAALDGAENPAPTDDARTGDAEPAADGRMAVVARRFVRTHLADREARGITGGDRIPLDFFEPIVNFAPVHPDELEAVEAE